MRESVKIILQCIEKLPKGPVKSIDNKITPPNRDDLKAVNGSSNPSF